MKRRSSKTDARLCCQKSGTADRTNKRSAKRLELSALARCLREQTHKVTGPRQAILEILRQNPYPLTIKNIFALLPKDQCNLATIYRMVHLLEGMDLVKRFDFSDAVARYELVGENNDPHHHHLVCTRCGKVVRIQECFVREMESRIAAAHRFASVTHKLEFFGLCPRCQPGYSKLKRNAGGHKGRIGLKSNKGERTRFGCWPHFDW